MHAPLAVGAHHFLPPVRIFEPQFADGFEGSERADKLRVAAAAHVVHPIAEQDSQGVVPGPQQRRDVIGVVKHGLVVLRPSGGQQVVANPPAVESQLVLAQAAKVDHRPRKVRLHRELTAQKHGRIPSGRGSGERGWQRLTHCVNPCKRLAFRDCFLSADPTRVPIGIVEHSHGPGGNTAPRRRLFLLIPNLNLPNDLLGGSQGFASVRQLIGPVRWNAARIPEVALILRQQGCGRGDQNAIRRLPDPALIAVCGYHDPTEARRGNIDSEGVNPIFAAQSLRPAGCKCRGSPCRQEERQHRAIGYSMDWE